MSQPTNRTEWLKAREKGLGASDVVAVMGLSSFSSPWAIWLSKVKPEESLSSGGDLAEMAEAGRRHEPTIAKWFEEKTKMKAVDPGEFHLSWSKDCSYLFTTLDRMAYPMIENARLVDCGEPLELKCAFYEAAKEWQKRVPLSHQAQIQQQIFCTGSKRGYFAVLLNGYRFKWFEIARNQRFIDAMLRKCEAFWKLVETQEPPPADFSQATSDALRAYYNKPEPARVELDSDWWDVHERRELASKEVAKWSKIKDECSNRIKAAIGNCELAVLHDGSTGYSWKATAKGRSLRKVKVQNDA